MKAGSRLPFFAALFSILAATALVGGLIYQATFDTLRTSYQQLLDRSVEQGVYLVESYLGNQRTLLSLYASVPSVQQGRFSDLPDWLRHPAADGISPKRLAILDAQGRGVATTGQTFLADDRPYFLQARAGVPTVAGPVVSRIDHVGVVVVAQPIPGGHPAAAVLTASIDLQAFRNLLGSVQGLSGAELSLTEAGGAELASTEGAPGGPGQELLTSVRRLDTVPWTLTARVPMADIMAPVRQILILVGLLIVTGVGLVVVFFLTGLRHRRDLEEAREDRTQALRDAYEQIRKLAYHDTVTRLPNRNLATRRLSEALQARAPRRVFVVALSRFRNLTTTFGLRFGDAILKETAARLTRFAEADPKAFLARLGGSEFLVLLDQETSPPDATDRLLALFSEPMGQDGLRFQVNVHVGTCSLEEGGVTAEEVIKSAETALWAAREKGPSEASELTVEAVRRRLRRAELQRLLPEALARGEMEVHFQPQTLAATGAVTGYEALLRWTNPELGPVSPVEFIPAAEETGLIVPLGDWVLDEGLAFSRALAAAGRGAVVSVNVSPVQFLQTGFLDAVSAKIAAAGLGPGTLGLEITESVLMEGIDQIRPSLDRLMAQGVKIALDDFGTGYSSLNYLRELPLHVLKIDKSFIDAIGTDDRAGHLIETIIRLAHHLGLQVLAEGVETELQHRRLADIGCDLIQGYYTGRPRPASAHLERAPE